MLLNAWETFIVFDTSSVGDIKMNINIIVVIIVMFCGGFSLNHIYTVWTLPVLLEKPL